jgi:hypothetical protein
VSGQDGRPDLYAMLGERLDDRSRAALAKVSSEIAPVRPEPCRAAWKESVEADVRALAAAEGWTPADVVRWVGSL